MRDTMPPPAQGGAAPAPSQAPAEGGDEGGGGPQEIIVDIDKRLGALAQAATSPEAKAVIEEVRDFFQAKMEELLSGGGGKAPAGGPVTPEQGAGGPNVRPAGPA